MRSNTPVIAQQCTNNNSSGAGSIQNGVVSAGSSPTDPLPEPNDSISSEYIAIDETCCDDSDVLSLQLSIITDSADEGDNVGHLNPEEGDRDSDINNNEREHRSPSWHLSSY